MSGAANDGGPEGLDLLYGDVEESLRSAVRDLLADRCPPAAVAACYDGDRGLTPPLWKALAVDLDLAGLLVPREYGGAGASAREAAVVLGELGRFVAPVPFLTSAVVGTAVLNHAGTPAAAEQLAALAAGTQTAAPLVPLTAGPAMPPPGVRADHDRLSGRVTSVAGALDADLLLVPADVGRRTAVYGVPTSAARVEPVTSLDMTRPLADVRLDGVPATPLVPADVGAAAVADALGLGAALLASEQVGVAQWCLDATVGYLGQRRQFGRVVGGFQALKHRLADLYVEVEQARAAARYAAAACAADDPDRAVATALAQAFCAEVAVHAAEEAVQLHGGIGMTWEHPAHLYLKRAKADQLAYGSPDAHLRRLGELVDLPGPRVTGGTARPSRAAAGSA